MGGGLTGLCMAMLFLPNLKDKRWRRLEKLAARMQVTDTLRRIVYGVPSAASGGGTGSQQTGDCQQIGETRQIDGGEVVQTAGEEGGILRGQGGTDQVIPPPPSVESVWSRCNVSGINGAEERSSPGISPPISARDSPEADLTAESRKDSKVFDTFHSTSALTVEAGSAAAGQGPHLRQTSDACSDAMGRTNPPELSSTSFTTDSMLLGGTCLDPTAIRCTPEEDSISLSEPQGGRGGTGGIPGGGPSEGSGSLTVPSPSSSSLEGLKAAYYLPHCTLKEPSSSVPTIQEPIILTHDEDGKGFLDLRQRRRRSRTDGEDEPSRGRRYSAGGSGGLEGMNSGGGDGEGSRRILGRGSRDQVQSCWRRYQYVWYVVNGICATFILMVLLVQPMYIYLSIFPRLNCPAL